MKVIPIVRVSDLHRALPFYQLLGLRLIVQNRVGTWAELGLSDAVVALSAIGELPLPATSERVVLSFESDVPLDVLAGRLAAGGYPPEAPAFDEAFGRTLVVHDPDGLRITVNERDRELYT